MLLFLSLSPRCAALPSLSRPCHLRHRRDLWPRLGGAILATGAPMLRWLPQQLLGGATSPLFPSIRVFQGITLEPS